MENGSPGNLWKRGWPVCQRQVATTATFLDSVGAALVTGGESSALRRVCSGSSPPGLCCSPAGKLLRNERKQNGLSGPWKVVLPYLLSQPHLTSRATVSEILRWWVRCQSLGGLHAGSALSWAHNLAHVPKPIRFCTMNSIQGVASEMVSLQKVWWNPKLWDW